MKSLLTLLFFAIISLGVRNKPKEVHLLVLNSNVHRGGQNTPIALWGGDALLDTISISNGILFQEVINHINSLKETELFPKEELDFFDHWGAFIVVHSDRVDTLYLEKDFEHFKLGSKPIFYQDSTGFFKRTFGGLFIEFKD